MAQYTWRGEKVEDIFFTMLMNYKNALMTRFVDLYNKNRAIKAESLNTYNIYEKCKHKNNLSDPVYKIIEIEKKYEEDKSRILTNNTTFSKDGLKINKYIMDHPESKERFSNLFDLVVECQSQDMDVDKLYSYLLISRALLSTSCLAESGFSMMKYTKQPNMSETVFNMRLGAKILAPKRIKKIKKALNGTKEAATEQQECGKDLKSKGNVSNE